MLIPFNQVFSASDRSEVASQVINVAERPAAFSGTILGMQKAALLMTYFLQLPNLSPMLLLSSASDSGFAFSTKFASLVLMSFVAFQSSRPSQGYDYLSPLHHAACHLNFPPQNSIHLRSG